MICKNCGATIEKKALFCGNCGMPQDYLIKQVISGDQHAFELLYNYSYQSVYWTIHSMANLDEDTIYDIMQDSYLRAFRSLPQLNDSTKFNGWIKRIAQNETLDYLRKSSKNNIIFFSDMTSDDSDVEEYDVKDQSVKTNPEASMEYQDRSRLLNEILDAIPEEQRLVLSMYYIQEMSIKEIAEELGVSENTVKSRMSYGRKKVEKSVLDLEKKGVGLLGLTAMGFFTWLLTGITSDAAAGSVPDTVFQGLQQAIREDASISASFAGGHTTGMTAEEVGSSVRKVAKEAGKKIAKTISKIGTTKILTGAIIIAVVGTGAGALVNRSNNKKNVSSTVVETVEDTSQNNSLSITEEQNDDSIYFEETENSEYTMFSTEPNYYAEASIDNVKYDRLESACAAVKDGQTIMLLRDASIGLGINFNVDASYTIDLNGNKLTGLNSGNASLNINRGDILIKNGSLQLGLVISDKASATLSDIDQGEKKEYLPLIQIEEKGMLTIGSGTYYGLENNGTVDIESGTFVYLINNESGVMTIEDAIVEGDRYYVYQIDNRGEMVIEDGNFSGKAPYLSSDDGSVTDISGGTFTCTSEGNGIFFSIYDSTVNITGGTFIYPAEDNLEAIQVAGESSYLRMSGGTIKAWCKDALGVDQGNFEMSGGSIEAYGPESNALTISLEGKAVIRGGSLYSEKGHAIYTYDRHTLDLISGDVSTGDSNMEDIFVYYK